MKIVMFTNTYLPHVGGVARSVAQFTRCCRRRGHRVVVAAPEYDEQPEDNDEDVWRMPSLRHVASGNFAIALPAKFDLADRIDVFDPDVIHTHHPFWVGDTALRVAALQNRPIVLTYHTMYEHYTHYMPVDVSQMGAFVVKLTTGFANLCDRVIAPSQSVRDILQARGVSRPIDVVPTGVDVDKYAEGDGAGFRETQGLPSGATVIGHVGRLAEEKNLVFLTRAVAEAMQQMPDAHFLAVGSGSAEGPMRQILRQAGLGDRAHFPGVLKGQDLADAYHAMDAFAFASRTETQGMVLTEAMSAGVPVIALDAPGAREAVKDGENGALVEAEDVDAFASAVRRIALADGAERERLIASARDFAREFCMSNTTDLLEQTYQRLRKPREPQENGLVEAWNSLLRSVRREWDIWSNRVSSLGKLSPDSPDTEARS
jgi:glycosyltransferase involved in cell wall biosynthesis